jgi:cellobiose phosphorylase
VTGEIYGGLQEGRTGRGGSSMRAFIAARLGGNGEATDEAIARLFPAAGGKSGISQWQSCSRNLYASTAYLRMVLRGLCGVHLDTEGLTFHPTVPKGMSPVAAYELPYRLAELEIHITGEGNVVKKITINGQEARTIPTTATGKQVVRIEMDGTKK